VLIPECYFASKSSAAVCEALRIAYPEKEVPNQNNYYNDVTKAYKYCCSYGCILNEAACIKAT
jgi:hypothetical protein